MFIKRKFILQDHFIYSDLQTEELKLLINLNLLRVFKLRDVFNFKIAQKNKKVLLSWLILDPK